MARAGKRDYLILEAPVMYIDNEPVWMDRNWFPNFLDFLKGNHFKIKGINVMNQKIKIRFSNPDHVIMFGLMYDRAKEEKIF